MCAPITWALWGVIAVGIAAVCVGWRFGSRVRAELDRRKRVDLLEEVERLRLDEEHASADVDEQTDPVLRRIYQERLERSTLSREQAERRLAAMEERDG